MKSPLRAHVALITMVIIWGVNFSISKIALSSISPLAFNALRFPMAALLLLTVLAIRGEVKLPPRRDVARVLFVGLLGNVLYQMFFILGLDHTRAGVASLLLAGTPIITALLSAASGHERVVPRIWIGVGCTFAGIILIVVGGAVQPDQAHLSLAGDLLMLGASVTWAIYTVGSRPLVERHGAIAVTAWTLWVGTFGLVIAGAHSLTQVDFGSVSLRTWGAIAYAGLLSIGFSYMLWYYGVSQLGNTRTSSYSNLTPVVALISAWITLGEIPRLTQVVGAVIIISGVTIAQSGPTSQVPAVSPEL